jgi:hypothetical protein
MRFNKLYIACLALLAFFTQSCDKMNDLHSPYLDAGEIIYAAKVDSVAPGAGNKRIQLEMFVISQRIETMRIYWNDYKDSLNVQIGQKTGTWKTMLNNMPEKGYIFKYVSIDKYGHRSLPFEVTGNVYGDRFQAMLSNRVISKTTALVAGKTTITWSGAVDKGVRCDVTYKSTAGTDVTLKVPMTTTSTVITDLASDFKYRTLFLPEKTAIDTFYTDFKAVAF